LQISQGEVEVLYLALVFLVQLDVGDGGTRDALDVLLKLLLELDVKRMHAVLCVLAGALGCAVHEAELESCGKLVLACVFLYGCKALLEVDDGGRDSALGLVDVLGKAPGRGSVKGCEADRELLRVLCVSVSFVHVLLRVAQVVCAGGVCVCADAVDGMRGVGSNAIVRGVELSEQLEGGVSVCCDGSRPEACAAGGWVDFSLSAL
jgi:hypothetical protein